MSKIIAVKPILHGHHTVELDNGYKVTVVRGQRVPEVGEEFGQHPTLVKYEGKADAVDAPTSQEAAQ